MLVSPHLKRARKVGAVGIETQRQHVAAIVAGLLKAAFKGLPVAAQRRTNGGMWEGAIIGNRAFWGLADPLREAGLVGYRNGTRGRGLEWEPGEWTYSRAFGGQPAKLWATATLLQLAARHGVTAETVKEDWPTSRKAETKRIIVRPDRLVLCRSLGDNHKVAQLSPQQCDEADVMRKDVAALNERVAGADIRGCRAPAFRRSFRHDLRMGGRYYAIGTGNFQQMSEAERTHITINGAPVVEVDIHACNLSIFLALTGTRTLPSGDLYERVRLPNDIPNARAAVKEWMVETFGSGRLMSHWSRRAPETVRSIRPSVIRTAALRAYPALANLTVVLPPDLAASLPPCEGEKAVGQVLANWESRVMQGALGYVREYGVVGLPMHDALIVAKDAEGLAREGLSGAFFVFLKVTPRFK